MTQNKHILSLMKRFRTKKSLTMEEENGESLHEEDEEEEEISKLKIAKES